MNLFIHTIILHNLNSKNFQKYSNKFEHLFMRKIIKQNIFLIYYSFILFRLNSSLSFFFPLTCV